MMKNIKEYLQTVPSFVWVILVLLALVLLFWSSDDISNWWEERKQDKFDAKQGQYEKQIQSLKDKETELMHRAESAEAREQTKSIETDLLRKEISKYGINIEKAQQKIEDAVTEYQNDKDFMEKVKTGEVSTFELCQRQCKDSADVGYPCRVNYCDPFK